MDRSAYSQLSVPVLSLSGSDARPKSHEFCFEYATQLKSDPIVCDIHLAPFPSCRLEDPTSGQNEVHFLKYANDRHCKGVSLLEKNVS